MEPDRIEAALVDLGAESRALVELSVIREVADDDIASLLGTDEGAVRSRREDALAQLANEVGAESADDAGQLVRDIREPPPPPPVKRKRLLLLPVLLGGLLVAVVVALVLALAADPDDDGDNPAPVPSGERSVQVPGERAKLAPLAGGSGEGNAEVEDGTLELSVSGLPDPGGAGYQVWLYNSLSDARPLNGLRNEKEFELKTKLPEGADRYEFLDVSLEPADQNGNHSGQSVLRAPVP